MTVPHPDRHEHRAHALEPDVEACEQVPHRGIVGHQHPLAVDREREVAIPDLEGHAQRLFGRRRLEGQDRLEGPSTTAYQSAATWSTAPSLSTLPVGSASTSTRPAVVVTRRRPQRRSSAVSVSVSRSRPARSASRTSTRAVVMTGAFAPSVVMPCRSPAASAGLQLTEDDRSTRPTPQPTDASMQFPLPSQV
jgi:hypothetical protein